MPAASQRPTWWSPAEGSVAQAVRDVVRAVAATLALVLLFVMPGLIDVAVSALLDGGAR